MVPGMKAEKGMKVKSKSDTLVEGDMLAGVDRKVADGKMNVSVDNLVGTSVLDDTKEA